MILAAQVHLIDYQRRSFSFEEIFDAFDTSFQYLGLATVEFLGQLDDSTLALRSDIDVMRLSGIKRLVADKLADRLASHVR